VPPIAVMTRWVTVVEHIEIRNYVVADRPAVVALLRQALGERSGERTEDFFSWKHESNSFGPSAAWVAVDDGIVVGFRSWMRWEFSASGRTFRAARAVDTATAPRYQGKGIFRRLTLHSLELLREDRVDFVFNTPNSLSRPGYLKMGWQVVGGLPVRFRPSGPRALVRMIRAKTPADLWSVPTMVGMSIHEWVSAAEPLVIEIAARRRAGRALKTVLSTDFLRWRYGFEPLAYRVWPLGPKPDAGGVVFRLRRRGPVVEAALVEVLAPHPEVSGREVGRMVAATGADYALSLDQGLVHGMFPLPNQGPILTARGVAGESPSKLRCWSLALGDVELF